MTRAGISLMCLAAPVVCAAPATELPATVEKAFADYTALPGKLIPLLQKAQDTASADAVAPELHKSLGAIYDTRDQLHKLPRLSARQNEAVRAKYGQKMREEWGKMYEQITRLRETSCYQSVALAQTFRLMCMMIEK